MTRHEAMALVMELRAHYTQKIPDETILVYAKHLEAYDHDQASLGLRRLVEVEQDRFFPAWALVQRYVGEVRAGSFPPADEAWLELQAEIRRVGAYDQPMLHPLTAATVAATGGWVAACHAPEGNPWVRKEFVLAYEALAARASRTGHIPPAALKGIFASTRRPSELEHVTHPDLLEPPLAD